MKKLLIIILALFLLSGCSNPLIKTPRQYTQTYFDVFDTVTTVIGTAASEEDFHMAAEKMHEELLHYHRLFDIYNSYEGINNLKTVNEQATVSEVTVDKAILELLETCKTYYSLTGGKVNVAMGSVLQLWHEARTSGLNNPEKAYLPEWEALRLASEHTAIDDVIIDFQASTVRIKDEKLQLDVGAVAKGWAAQKVAENAPKGMLISVGGNVCATGPKTDDGMPWVIGIQHPDKSDGYLHTVTIQGGCVVTSGDYQRGYTVDGEFYHHIIDPDTLMPGTYWRSVTVICDDSAKADALSTALFLMTFEEGAALAKACGAEAMWVDENDREFFTTGFEKFMRS